jgi:DNA-binding MarR family transcriptional regulator
VQAAVDLSECRGCYCLAARRAARAITRLYEQKLRPHGLRATQFSVLAALALKGPTPVSELAALLGLERTTLTRVAVVLTQRGWLTDGRARDARERLLVITPEGRAKLETAFPAWLEAQTLVGARLEQEDEWQLKPQGGAGQTAPAA